MACASAPKSQPRSARQRPLNAQSLEKKKAPLRLGFFFGSAGLCARRFVVEWSWSRDFLTQDMTITPQMVEDLARNSADKDIAPINDIHDALQKPADRDFIERSLKAEIVAAKYGYDASYAYRLEGDTQVSKALDLFPAAQKLATLAAVERAKTNGVVPGQPGSRAAQANTVPKTN